MSKKYIEEECRSQIFKLYESGNLNRLYANKFLNRYGKTLDTKQEYQEVYARYIYSHRFDGKLPMITLCNVKEYCTEDRHDTEAENEEKVQRDFYFKRRKLDEKFGIPIWFELQTNGLGQGKGIDLVYYKQDTAEINIFELKYNSKESLLRAVLEIQTYYQRIDWNKAVSALKARGLIQSDYISKINKYVLFNTGCTNIYNKYNDLTDESYVKKLIDEFNIGLVIYE